MDRHDIPVGVTAEDVARIHQNDLEIQDEFKCKGLTYWFDGSRKVAFCLFEAPDENSVIEMHRKAHGQVPNLVIEVSRNVVESFLGRITDPEKITDTTLNVIDDHAFRIIMVIKADYPLLSINHNVESELSRMIATHDGRIVKHTSGGFLISFSSVSKAVNASFRIRDLLHEYVLNDNSTFKIGLTAGVPVTDHPQIFEETIQTAEWFCRIASGEIVISSTVRALYNEENDKPLGQRSHVRYMTKADEAFLHLLMNYIQKHWSDASFKVADLARPTVCSKSRLYRNLKLLSGQSPNEFIAHYRLDEARKILRNSEKTVAEVAFETGFSSASYFTKCFNKRYSQLPSNYLNRKLEE